MSDNKRDLTRIEDLGEYLHELNQDDEETSSQEENLESINDSSPFDSTEFSTNESIQDSSVNFGSADFGSSETDNQSEEVSDFNSDPFQDSSNESSEFEQTDSFNVEEPQNDFPDDEPPTFEAQETTEILTETPEEFTQDVYQANEEIQTSSFETFIPKEPLHSSENFQDLRKFAENTNISGMATEGNPSFSLLIKQVSYIEDVNDIIILLKELKLLQDSEDQVKTRLSRGTLLIPRISEFAAIFLAHKLRRLDIDIQVGPSDEIHPPKYQDDAEVGLVSKNNLYQNQNHHFHFSDKKLDLNQIIVSAISQLEGYQVVRYLGIASEHKVLESKVVENEDSSEIPAHYSDLAQKLKAHALKANANAVVGINYQLTPIPSELGISGHKYRLTCTGNLVWVQKI